MITTIISCIIANILTIVIIGAAIYLSYKKNQEKVDNIANELKERIESFKENFSEISESVNSAIDTLEEIRKKLDFTNV